MGIWNKIFGTNKHSHDALVDYSVLKTDIHSHLIPGIDDGAKSLEDSISLINGFVAFGYHKLITTPHIMGDFYRNTPEIILNGLDIVRNEIIKQNIPIQLEAAAEYYLDADFEAKLKNEKLLTFGDNYLLFEISYLNEPDGLMPAIFEMQMKGYKPVLAHPERYPYFYNKPEIYNEISERGALLQLNINSLSGHYGPGAVKIGDKLLKEGLVSFLGSDCHHSGHQNLMKKVMDESKLRLTNEVLNLTL
jgi:tyrosine-protein phosphatase YwqE